MRERQGERERGREKERNEARCSQSDRRGRHLCPTEKVSSEKYKLQKKYFTPCRNKNFAFEFGKSEKWTERGKNESNCTCGMT